MQTCNRYCWESTMGVIQWTFHYGGLAEGTGFCTFTEDYIYNNPELFEVELTEREFEHGAHYHLKYEDNNGYTVGQYSEPANKFYIIGSNILHNKYEFKEIGEKIKL